MKFSSFISLFFSLLLSFSLNSLSLSAVGCSCLPGLVHIKDILLLIKNTSLINCLSLHAKSVHLWRDGSSDRSFMVDPLTYFSFQPVLHDWCNKGRGMCHPVWGMVRVKEP